MLVNSFLWRTYFWWIFCFVTFQSIKPVQTILKYLNACSPYTFLWFFRIFWTNKLGNWNVVNVVLPSSSRLLLSVISSSFLLFRRFNDPNAVSKVLMKLRRKLSSRIMDPIQNSACLCLLESPKIRGFGYSRPEGMIDYQKIQKEEFHLPQYQFHT